MAALAKNKTDWGFLGQGYPSRWGHVQVTDTTQLYAGSFLAIGSRDHATAASRGRAFPWTSANGQIPFGFSATKILGATDGSDSSDNWPEATVEPLAPRLARKVAVTGVTARANIGRLVYMSDDNTITLTRDTADCPLGIIVGWYSSTSCDVLFFSFTELAVIAMSGSAKQIINFTCSAVIAASGVVANFIAPHKGRILRVDGTVTQILAGAGASLSYGVRIGGVAIGGGAVAAVLADAQGALKAGSAVTDDGTNVFHEGDACDVYCTMTTAATAGLVDIRITYLLEPGL